ncbi:FkbM family methyltransferase [Streptomyces sp. NPDC051677]|uniref:FkbM family methyltransferase n=1 Tax=Streptomyces sp. NPDC051677 TaxID=3365669 RepID=UPI0037D6758E
MTAGRDAGRAGPGTALDLSAVEGMNRHETQALYEDIVTHRSYLPDDVTLPRGATVLDIGANIGVFALFVQALCPTAHVYACEPLPPVFDRLVRNLHTHRVPGRALPYALSDRDGEAEFVFYPGYTVMSGERRHAAVELDKAFVRSLVHREQADELGDGLDFLDEMLDHRFREVTYHRPVRRLSTLIEEVGLDRVDLLKIDVQRAEIDVLNGIDDRHWPLVHRVTVEVHDEPGTPTEGRLSAVLTLLEERGYRARILPPPGVDPVSVSGSGSGSGSVSGPVVSSRCTVFAAADGRHYR